MAASTIDCDFDGATRTVVIDAPETSIGRLPGSDIVVDHTSVSREHAIVQRQADGVFLLIDLGSRNGTTLNSRPLRVASVLRDGDVIDIGPARLTFHSPRHHRAVAVDEDPTLGGPTVDDAPPALLGRSAVMARVFRQIERAAAAPIPVLVQGETGAGKELVARAIHLAGPRASGPFVAVNCAALPEALIESELFGYRRGAFTGAQRDHRGFLERASGGTLFLDEVGELPPPAQAKLLRALQEREVSPLGAEQTQRIDLRVVSATNRDLEREIAGGRFRADLYFRLAAFVIRLPALRERRGDVPLIARRLLAAAAQRQGKRVHGFDPLALELLIRCDWPGNVRELENAIERAVAMAEDGVPLRCEAFEDTSVVAARSTAPAVSAVEQPATPDAAPGAVGPAPLRDARAAFEAEHIARTLAAHGGNISSAARELGISRTALYKKIKEHGLVV